MFLILGDDLPNQEIAHTSSWTMTTLSKKQAKLAQGAWKTVPHLNVHCA